MYANLRLLPPDRTPQSPMTPFAHVFFPEPRLAVQNFIGLVPCQPLSSLCVVFVAYLITFFLC